MPQTGGYGRREDCRRRRVHGDAKGELLAQGAECVDAVVDVLELLGEQALAFTAFEVLFGALQPLPVEEEAAEGV